MNSSYGSFDLLFSYVPSVDREISILTNVNGVPSFFPVDAEALAYPISVRILTFFDEENTEMEFFRFQTWVGDEKVDQSDYPSDAESVDRYDVRVFFMNTRISVYINDKWVYSYAMNSIVYTEPVDLWLMAIGENVTVVDIVNREIADGREAVYVDYEANTDSAFSSIVQERPIEAYPAIGRAIQFTYNATKDEVPAVKLTSYREREGANMQVSSDGLVYAIDVGISIDQFVAEKLGMITRMYRLSELDTGVARAASALQRKARQSIYSARTVGRLDPRLEIGDVQTLDSVIISGTRTPITDRIIIEEISIQLSDGEFRQTITGRRDVDALS